MASRPKVLPHELQSALEEACLRAVREELGYTGRDSARTFDDRPPPSAGDVFLSIWSDNAREGGSKRTALYVEFGLSVTLSLRFGRVPFDRRVEVRDEMEWRLNKVTTLLHKDVWDFRHSRVAEQILGIASPKRAYHGGLAFQRWLPLMEVTADWYHGAGGQGGDAEVGIAQTAVFARSVNVQAVATAT